MASKVDTVLPARPDDRGVLARSLSYVRWVTLATLMLLALEAPLSGRGRIPIWVGILLFGGYNLLIELARKRWAWFGSFARIAILDLLVTALVYFCGLELSGPLFALLVLSIFCTAASTTLRGTLIYTAATMLIVLAIAPTFPLWSPNGAGIRELSARLLVLGVVGVSTTLIMQRLLSEQETARSMQAEAERLQELDRIRTNFIASISHDLKTPLTALRAALGMFETSVLDRLRPDERQLLENARRNIERLRLLIDDLLAYNQLRAGMLQLECAPLDLRTIVSDALSAVHPLIQQKGQILAIDLPEPLPSAGDRHWLGQVVINLLANAHQHTSSGTQITIAGHQQADEVIVAVSDTGPGIPRQELEAIFERFHRLDSDNDGVGLGLTIAKSLVELHGGRIWAESQLGHGASFVLALPKSKQGGAM